MNKLIYIIILFFSILLLSYFSSESFINFSPYNFDYNRNDFTRICNSCNMSDKVFQRAYNSPIDINETHKNNKILIHKLPNRKDRSPNWKCQRHWMQCSK